MTTPTIENATTPNTGWSRLVSWLRAVDEALDYDPVEHANDGLRKRVAILEDTVRRLETRDTAS